MDEIHKKSYTVTENHTAEKMGSGDLSVLSSPSLIAFMENCCKDMMAGLVEEGQTTVGTFISMKHSAPSKVGASIIVEARIKELSGSKYSFSVVARDGEEIIAIGEHTRAVVDSEKFMNNITSSPSL